MSYLELHDIHKSYFLVKEEFPVLKGIALNFDRGEFVSILGESGGGKSTLMNIIGGLDHNYQGDVVIDGKSLKDATENQMDAYRRDTIGFIFQNFNLIGHLSVLDNVLSSLDMTSLSHSDREKRAKDLLDEVGLSEHIHKLPGQLSGGQKQRVAIARALASDPSIIIADEPTGALDSKNTQDVLDILQKIAKSGKLVIVVTHSETVAKFGTRIVHLTDGKIDQDQNLKAPYPVVDNKKAFKSRSLPWLDSYKNAFKHLMFHFGRNFLIILGTAIGLFSVMFFLGLGHGATKYMNKTVDSLANPRVLQVSKHLSNNNTSDLANMKLTDKQLNTLKKLDHVKKVEKSYYVETFSIQIGQKNFSSQILQSKNSSFRSDSIKPGKMPGKNEIVVDKSTIAQAWSKKNWKKIVGKEVTLHLNVIDSNGNPKLLTKKLTVSGVSQAMSAVSYDTLGEIYKDAKMKFEPNYATIVVDNVNNVKSVKNKIRELKNSKGKRLYNLLGVGVILDNITQITSIVTFVLALIAGISLLVSALMIIVSMYMSVTERTKEIGILRAIGQRKKDIRRLFTSESLFIGIFAAILGLAMSFILQVVVNNVTYGMIKYRGIISITTGNIIFAFVIAIIISLLAAFFPSRRAARLDPIESLANE
ncbi:ATP-binding cassette domain-containing protein [Xylocopilactobacillus apicola]|uniref:ABC transporter ATP-binding protein n=1 Tax=Xylocopilactobacillus apicola TaxID=2932184 RepID=A0AAU9D950_9LACO|nr:ABC transporter ATP-binding protein/permease [Xylocopilactobacillus apicola]BDR58931.1 ABC transporter ATP-binding protein [Xylocopilactobacillus apicola]